MLVAVITFTADEGVDVEHAAQLAAYRMETFDSRISIVDTHVDEVVEECEAARQSRDLIATYDEILDAKLNAHADAVANHEDQQHE